MSLTAIAVNVIEIWTGKRTEIKNLLHVLFVKICAQGLKCSCKLVLNFQISLVSYKLANEILVPMSYPFSEDAGQAYFLHLHIFF